MKNFISAVVVLLFLNGCASSESKREGFFEGLFPDNNLPEENASGEENGFEENNGPAGETPEQALTEYIEASGGTVAKGGIFLPSLTEEGDGITLNFINTDIRAVIAAIAGSMLNRTFKIDPSISGNLTLQTSAPVASDALLPILEDALSLEDIAIVDASGFLNFVPMSKAPGKIGSLRVVRPGSKGTPGFSVQVIPLSFTKASEMQKVLTPFAPQGGIIRVDDDRQLLILAGTSQEMALMKQTIQMFDVNWFAGKSFALFKPRNVEVGTLADELRDIFDGIIGGSSEALRLVPIPRINTLLGISSDLSLLKNAEDWVRRLDVAENEAERKIFVYYVKNGRVEDLAFSLGAIFSNSGQGRQSQPLPVQQGSPGPTATTTTFRQGQGAVSIGEEGFKVVPDTINNALLIYGTPLEYRLIEDALLQLDIPAKQILIEVTLAEVTLNDELKFGVQWFFEEGNNSLTLSDVTSGAAASVFPGFSYVFNQGDNRRAVLNALSSVTDVNVLSSPKVMVLNNQPATIQVGDQVPVTTQSAVSVLDPDAPIVNSVQFRDTGVIMSVTPHANQSGVITLDITQEVSDVVPTTSSGIDSPTIQQRRITSTVVLQSGQTIALGGLIRHSISNNQSGVPILSKIPILGNLFKSNDDTERRTELIVLITARVASNPAESQEVLDYLKGQFSFLVPREENEKDE